jgi:hypothetical protein
MKGTVMRYAKKSIVTLFAGAAMVTAVAAPASAAGPQNQDGLVNVAVGDVTILQDVNVAAVVGVAATVCDVTVGPVSAAILGQATAVDRSGRSRTICMAAANGQPVTLIQN